MKKKEGEKMRKNPNKPSDKEILFMQIVANVVKQYLELTDEETVNFVCDIMDKLDLYQVRIK